MERNVILHGSALDKLKELDSDSIDTCITSPPYWALRDYKQEGQLGLEPTFQEYLDKLIEIFKEVKRVIKKQGSIWVNIGDTYNAGRSNRESIKPQNRDHGLSNATDKQDLGFSEDSFLIRHVNNIPQKSLIGIPERFKLRMIDELGLTCRNTIIWHKRNCMPSSAKDRFTIDFEYVYFFTKSVRYFFETQYEPLKEDTEARYKRSPFGGEKNIRSMNGDRLSIRPPIGRLETNPLGRMKRCVWTINTQPFKEAHFAVFPEKLIEPMILAGCPPNGTVLDPFIGSGTTALVALKHGRDFIGIELSKEYVDMAMKRLEPYLQQTRLFSS